MDHFFGTDDFGRDVFARVVHGARMSLIIGFQVTVVASLIGAVIGLLAGFFPRLDTALSRMLDALMSFPDILLAIALMAAIGPSVLNVVLALGLAYSPRIGRIVRAGTLALRHAPYIEASTAMGASNRRLIFVHVLPNVAPLLLVQGTFVFAFALLTESALSFLGTGVPPEVPTLGNMIASSQLYIRSAAWMMVFPGIAIATAVLCLQTVGDGLRDSLDPILRNVR
jgi:peptide/nickel transport system permease protein